MSNKIRCKAPRNDSTTSRGFLDLNSPRVVLMPDCSNLARNSRTVSVAAGQARSYGGESMRTGIVA